MAINTTQIKNNVYKAIEVIAEERINGLELDKTIIGTIEGKVSNSQNQYRIRYNGGTLYAYAQGDDVYLPNLTVYVLVPKNDFNNKKWIIGRVSNTQIDSNIDTVANALNNYSIIGNNTITVNDNINKEGYENVFKLKSYDVKTTMETFQDANVLYDVKQPELSVLNINNNDLLTYVRQAQAISLAADFRTSLSKEQQRRVSGNYGILFNLRFKNANTAYNTIQDKWNALEPNTRVQVEINHEKQYRSLNFYENEIKNIIVESLNDETKTVKNVQDAIQSYFNDELNYFVADILVDLDSETQSLVDQYMQLIIDITSLTINENDIEITKNDLLNEYDGWFAESGNSYVEILKSYYLDTNNMIGNPYNFSTYAHQYIVTPIDAENFIGVDSIYFFCDGFISDNSKAEQWGYDLFVKNIEINCLEELTDVNDEYRLILDYPQGTIFKTNEPTDTRKVRARFVRYNQEDLTSFSSVYWFKEDSSINKDSPNYNALAGIGWRRIDVGNITTEVDFAASDNKSYENHYKVISTYNMEIFLVKEFTLFNETNKHDISIISDSGFTFELSEEDKHLTCLIDEKILLENYDYIWYLNNEILEHDANWYKEEIDRIVGIDRESLQQRTYYTNKLNQLEGISWDKNVLTFPSSQIPASGSVDIICFVEYNDGIENYTIGKAEVQLSQGEVQTLNGYHIEIENGGQTFQYNEAGVSPASDRYDNPIEILPLQCKFYSPAGGLINRLNYTVKWQIPQTNTLILSDKSKIDAEGYNNSEICVFAISNDYDYSAFNNQITCIVNFKGDTYTETTDFFFGKIGENGTNGTDVVAKIVPIEEKTNSVLNDELLTLIIAGDAKVWNTGADIDSPVLELQLYRRNTYIDPNEYSSVKWDIAGSTRAKRMSVAADNTVNAKGIVSKISYADEEQRVGTYVYCTNQVIKGQADLKIDTGYQTYNYFYPIPTIIWEPGQIQYHIGIDKKLTMRQVLYNADGRNPAYNKNQGIKLNLPYDDRIISWTAIGGIEDDETTSALTIRENEEDNTFVYVIPSDTYSGEYTNNCVKAEIKRNDILECTIIIPIHMSLNTYGLASLNAWDGNSIDINEEDGYILAPQIGAGKKENNNTFTGVVMGVESTYEDKLVNEEIVKQKKEQVGLLGYSYGKQSIFLNAEDGSATFGLPEVQSDKNDPYTEGRIQLNPGGVSHIGNWKIGSRSLYNVIEGDIDKGYKDALASGHISDVPHDKQGVMFSADPAYVSIKGRILTEEDISTNANRVINAGDSLEIQLDPAQQSLFTIFRHYKDDNDIWHRKATVGIDKQGRFYSNALRQEATTLAIGFVGGFGKTAVDEKYIGVSVDVDDTTIWKLFSNYNNGVTNSSTLYLSGATNENNDYQRPIQIMGSELNLRTSSNNDNSRINMTTTSMMLGQKNAQLNLNNTTGSLITSGAFTRTVGGLNTETLKASSKIDITGTLTETITGNTAIDFSQSKFTENNNGIFLKRDNYYDLAFRGVGDSTNYSNLTITNKRFILQSNSNQGASSNDGGTIGVHALNTNYGITLRTTPIAGTTTAYNAGLRLVPSRGGTSSFNLYADGQGQVYTGTFTLANLSQKAVLVRDNVETHGLMVSSNNITYATNTKCSIYTTGDIIAKTDIKIDGGVTLKTHKHDFSKAVAISRKSSGNNSYSNGTITVRANANLAGSGAWANAWNGSINSVSLRISWRGLDNMIYVQNFIVEPGSETSYRNGSDFCIVNFTDIDQNDAGVNYGCGHYAELDFDTTGVTVSGTSGQPK